MQELTSLYPAIATYMHDEIIAWRVCQWSWRSFAIYKKDFQFLEKLFSTLPWYNSGYLVLPTLDFRERQRKRLMHRNERNYFRATCALTARSIITNYDPTLHQTIYDTQVWRSDQRDASIYAQDWNKNKSFFSQYQQLHYKVPKIALMNDNRITSSNCDYTYDILYCKDCYMTVEAISDVHSHYCMCVHRSEYMVDCAMVYDSQYCIECTDSSKLYKCIYAQYCHNSKNLLACRDCHGCDELIGCVGLKNKKYCIFNEQLEREQYFQKKDKFMHMLLHNKKELLDTWRSFLQSQSRLYANIINAERCIGDNIINSKDICFGFELPDCHNCRYCFNILDSKDSRDIDVSTNLDHCYESITPDMSRNTAFSIFTSNCQDVRYSEMCHRCKSCFACVGLRDKQYCIFNKQYSKQEYETLIPQIIASMIEYGERGQFFPSSLSSHAYNRSDAMQRYPLTCDQAIEKGYMRDDNEITANIPSSMQTIDTDTMEVDPDKTDDTQVNRVYLSSLSKRPYRIVASELLIYRKLWYPLPCYHHDERFTARMASRLERNIFLNHCYISWEQLFTPYNPSDWYNILSYEEYQKRVF